MGMSRDRLTRIIHIRGRTLALATASIVPLVFALPALAKVPTGDFAIFGQCPRFTPNVSLCLYSTTIAGGVAIGGLTMPISHPIVIQGGLAVNEGTGAESFSGALNGETFSKAPQPVPGGLLGIVTPALLPESLKEAFRKFVNGLADVTGTTELAKPASSIKIDTSNLINSEGVALSVLVKLHLRNPFLGDQCYIGSDSNPITLNLTSGETNPPAPNKPISGKVGDLRLKDAAELAEDPGNVLVDNTFSAPRATGCGGFYSLAVDSAIDAKLGLPSPAGHNTIVQSNTLEEATTEGVLASER